MDSHSYSPFEDVRRGYAWLTFDQINWYRQQSAAYKVQNGGQPLPALFCFFHITLPEYNEGCLQRNAILRGTRMEEAQPKLNTGMFCSDEKELCEWMGMFVGHDHDNDFMQ